MFRILATRLCAKQCNALPLFTRAYGGHAPAAPTHLAPEYLEQIRVPGSGTPDKVPDYPVVLKISAVLIHSLRLDPDNRNASIFHHIPKYESIIERNIRKQGEGEPHHLWEYLTLPNPGVESLPFSIMDEVRMHGGGKHDIDFVHSLVIRLKEDFCINDELDCIRILSYFDGRQLPDFDLNSWYNCEKSGTFPADSLPQSVEAQNDFAEHLKTCLRRYHQFVQVLHDKLHLDQAVASSVYRDFVLARMEQRKTPQLSKGKLTEMLNAAGTKNAKEAWKGDLAPELLAIMGENV